MNPVHPLRVGEVEIGRGRFVLMAGPCVLESLEMGLGIAQEASRICADLGIPYIFKASYDNCYGWTQMLCALKAYLEYGINLRQGMFI